MARLQASGARRSRYRSTGVGALSLSLTLFLAVTARAELPSEPWCRHNQHVPVPVDLAAIAGGSARRLWGRENMTLLPKENDTQGAVLRVRYPKGSANPGRRDTPRGGAGFELTWPTGAEQQCLSYLVRFPLGFDFVKGGKLPGLFGGDAPRGCVASDLATGFSARLMWRADGQGELYLYAPDRTTRCGESINRGSWVFPSGRWVAISEEIVLNGPGSEDGIARVWIDGKKVVERTSLVLREHRDIRIEGLLFSTFFGGSDATWASPRDQYVDFADFRLWD